MKHILFKYMSRFTTLPAEEQHAIVEKLVIEQYQRGTTLLRQGEAPDRCYFILKGCIRQYSVDETGKETTSSFYTEEQAIAIFNTESAYSFTCLEDCIVVVGDLQSESDAYSQYPQLEKMTRKMIEESLSETQNEWAQFIASSPEERYKALLKKRPSLIDRVPQHQLASYLGITPESLSRIKKRLANPPS
jgi:CRP-like cAMP-binding protein